MVRLCFPFAVAASVVILFSDQCAAQIGVGFTRQNGVVTGGSLQVGGFVTPDRTRVRLGLSSSSSNLIGVGTFNVRNGGGNGALANNARRPQPSPEQFVRAAGRFDLDRNDLLDQEELTQVASAVIAEIKQRLRTTKRPSRSGRRNQAGAKSPAKDLSAEQIVEVFVAHCLTFDADDDDALNPAETKRMAAALIRSLG